MYGIGARLFKISKVETLKLIAISHNDIQNEDRKTANISDYM